MIKLPNPRSNAGSTDLTLDWIRSNCSVSCGCWVWLGSIDRKGYGRIRVKRKSARVHNITCALAARTRPIGLVSDHVCRQRACCNPDHIEFVTPQENTRRGLSLKHADSKCGACGSTRLIPRKWGHACLDCLKRYEQTPDRKAQRAGYERARAATPKRREQVARMRAQARIARGYTPVMRFGDADRPAPEQQDLLVVER